MSSSNNAEGSQDVAFTLKAMQQQFERFNMMFGEIRDRIERQDNEIAEMRGQGRQSQNQRERETEREEGNARRAKRVPRETLRNLISVKQFRKEEVERAPQRQ
nr:hypothetical protein CRG98_039106 [Ipomoea trifida]